MFDPNPTRDPNAARTTRRLFVLGAGATAAWLFLRRPTGVQAGTSSHGAPGPVSIVRFSNAGHDLGAETVQKIVKTDAEWAKQLSANAFNIARHADTEMPGYGLLLNEHRPGVFRCVCCETALFSAATKFDSHTGWPSFYAPIAKQNVAAIVDRTLGIERTEVQCARCEGHLGHVFDDGPEPTGLRYCINSASLDFTPA